MDPPGEGANSWLPPQKLGGGPRVRGGRGGGVEFEDQRISAGNRDQVLGRNQLFHFMKRIDRNSDFSGTKECE